MTRPIYATIDTAAVAHNLSRVKYYAPNSFIWAVIKANAYGHGIEHIYPGLYRADGLAMVDFSEAKRVRHLGWTRPILMIEGCFDADDINVCAELNLIPVIHSHAQLVWHTNNPIPLKVYIKVNSGMNRLGFALNNIPADLLSKMPHLSIVMWLTHFANADILNGVNQPLKLFETTLKTVFKYFPALNAPFSTSNSAAIIGVCAAHYDAVRAGIMMYGASPLPFNPLKPVTTVFNLRPVMSLYSKIIAVQQLNTGDPLGYGSTFTATTPIRIGIVACGYADGYPRHAPTGTPIAVSGIITRTLGRVSMDMLAVDLTPVPDADIDSTVELWGATVLVDSVAQAAGTIGYELLCALAQRVAIICIHSSVDSSVDSFLE
jgi:alanine racemase